MMKMSWFKVVRNGCVALVVTAAFLLFAAWNAPSGEASGVGCYGTTETHGSDESPERCYLDDPCKDLPDNCSGDYNGSWYRYTDSMYVGDCEAAPCPQSARCIYCNGVIVCAMYKSYTSQAKCLADEDGVSGNTAKSNKCDDSEGT